MANPMAVPGTVYKWYPGHYVLLYGMNSLPDRGLTAHLNQIAGTGANNIPNLVGIQKRYTWRELEVEKDNYYGTDGNGGIKKILEDLDECRSKGKFLRIFLTFKGFNGGKGCPDYLRPGRPGYEDAFGSGVYNWPDGTTTNEHPALYLPAVKARYKKLLQVIGQAVDGGPGMAATDSRWWLSCLDINETSWGQVPAVGGKTSVENMKEICKAFIEGYDVWKAAAPTTLLCHFVNFPNNASFSVLNDPDVGLPKALKNRAFMLGSPDNWLDASDLVGYPGRPGILTHYDNVRGLIGLAPSNQEANYSAKDHEQQRHSEVSYDLTLNGTTIDLMFKRITTEGCIYKSVFRQPSHGSHITWAARTEGLGGKDATSPPGNVKPWDLVRDYFRKLWDNDGPWKHNKAPYIKTDVPILMQSVTPPPPGVLTVALTNDTGVSSTDKVTNDPRLTVSNAAPGAIIQYAIDEAGPWSTTEPTWVQGGNTILVRQVVGGLPSDPTPPVEFKYDNVAPTVLRCTVADNIVRVTYLDTILLADAETHRPDKSCFVVKKNGTPVTIDGRFVSAALKFIRLELRDPVLATDVVTVSYTQPTTGLLRTQDLAGNLAANFTDLPCNNLTGVPAPTKTVTITELGGSPPGGYTREDQVVLKGTVSAPLAGYEEIEVRKRNVVFPRTDPDTYYYVQLGAATVTGTTWQFQDLERGNKTFEYDARVRNGDLVGPSSPLVSITVDDQPPAEPTVNSVAVRVGEPVVVTGAYGGGVGDSVEVQVQGTPTPYTTSNGLVVNVAAKSWSLPLGVMPQGRYGVSAKVTDLAGNFSENEYPGFIDVVPLPSINELRLAFAKRAE